MKVTFKAERETKNTIRFEEVPACGLDAPAIGTIYIPKGTLLVLGWTEGEDVTVDIKKEAKK